MKQELKDNLSNVMKNVWANPEKRASIMENMKKAGKKRKKHSDIEVDQRDDHKTYMREYQRKYRLAHPNYYKDRARKKKAESMEVRTEE